MSKMKFQQKKGIVLITTMLSVVLVVMLLSAVVYSNIGSLRLTSNFYDREQALIAADSGIQYALTRLQDNINWKAEEAYELNQDSLHVKEFKGNVVGIVSLSNGRRSAFRIKFNCEDGNGGLDGMADSGNAMDMLDVSSNNLSGSAEGQVHIAQHDGRVLTENGKAKTIVIKDSAISDPDKSVICIYPITIPKNTCRIAAEGISGAEVSSLTLDDLINLSNKLNKAARAGAEAYFAADTDALYGDSAASSGGSLTLNASDKIILSRTDGPCPPNIRVLEDSNINYKNDFISDGASVYFGKTSSVKKDGAVSKAITQTLTAKELNSDKITALAWEDIPKAKQNECPNLSGTYIWTKDGNNNVLMHYNESFTDPSLASQYSGTKVTGIKGGTIKTEDRAIIFTQNSYINGDFNVLNADSGEEGTRPIVGFAYGENEDQAILTAKGKIFIQGATLGSGAITAEDSVTIEGTSVLESNPDMGVSIYSKGDIEITSISTTTKPAKDADASNSQNQQSGQCAAPNSNIVIFADEDKNYAHNISEKFIKQLEKYLKDQYGITKKLPENLSTEIQNTVKAAARGEITNPELTQNAKENLVIFLGAQLKDKYDAEIFKSLVITMEDQINNARSYYHNKKSIKFTFSDTSGINLNDDEDDSVTQTKTEKVSENSSISSIYGETYSKNKAEQLDSLITKYKNLKYKDLDMTGVLYAQGKIKIDMGDEVLNITGTITSYGGNPAEEDPGASGKGSIDINAGKLGITYDPTYLNSMLAASKRRKLKKVMYGTY